MDDTNTFVSDCHPPLSLHMPLRCHPNKVKRKQIPAKNMEKCPQVVTIQFLRTRTALCNPKKVKKNTGDKKNKK